MSENTWDRIWSRTDARDLWSLPDPDVEALVPILREEGVSRVLDLGCGMGRHTVLLAASGFETYATDLSGQGIERCRTWLAVEGLVATITRQSMAALAYPDDSFGFVVSWNVVYHAVRDDIVSTLAEIYRVTRRNGLLYLTLNSTRNRKYGKGTEIEPGTFDDPESGEGHHLHHYSDRADAEKLLSAWKIERIEESEVWLDGKIRADTWHWMILARKEQCHTTASSRPLGHVD